MASSQSTTKYVLLARFSPRPDAATSESNESQLRDLRAHVAKVGGTIVAEFSDEDMSGDDEERPGLWGAIEALKRGYVLLVWKADRLARSVFLSERLQRDVQAVGARIEYLHGINGEGIEQTLVRQILAAFDEFTKKSNAVRTKYSMLSHQKNGKAMGSKAPYGQKIVFGPPRPATKRRAGEPTLLLEPDPDEQSVIEIIVNQHKAGYSYGQIAEHLRNHGIDCRGGQWHRKTLARIVARSA